MHLPLYRLAPVLAAVCVLPALPQGSQAQTNPPLRFTFLALDRGEATLVELPNGSPVLIGAGAPSEGPQIIRFLKKRGITRLDTLLITTWKDQQLGGATDVLKGLGARQFFHNTLYAGGPRADAVYAYAQQQQKLKKLAMGSPGPGQSLTFFFSPPCRLNVVAPTGPMISRFAGDADCSLVTEFSYDRLSVLQLGETTRKHQQAMWETDRDKPEGQVLAIGHSGATDALLPSLLKPLKTRIAVIPVARRSGQTPSAETLAQLRKVKARVYRTDLQGNITVTTDGRSIDVKTGS